MIALTTEISHNITTGMLVWGVCIGAILAFTVYFFQMRILCALVRALLSQARGEENAKTLDEIGKNHFVYRFFLREKSPLRKYVFVVGGVLPQNSEAEADFSLARFYIDEDKASIAEIRYSKETKIWVYVVAILTFLAVGAIMYFVLPWLLNFIG